MQDTPRGLRLHIGFYGRRNVGKSSLLNALVGQQAAIVSDTPGTTTDPVEKTMELAPLGPVVFIDTAGIDDVGALGEARRKRTLQAVTRTDLAVIVAEPGVWGPFEEEMAGLLKTQGTSAVCVVNKSDLGEAGPAVREGLARFKLPAVAASARTGGNIAAVRELLAAHAPRPSLEEPRLVADLLPAGGLAVLVVPIDLGAPRGRLILPQVQAIRDALDADACCLVVKERELAASLARLKGKPDLVVCDSQVVLKAAADTPAGVPLTTFSILMARMKGDLSALARGAAAIADLSPGDRVLIAEACTHHPLADDIGRVKIPRWLRQYAGGELEISVQAGKEFPPDLGECRLIVHCGGCVINRANMLSRLREASAAGVPMTNYGLAISLVQGLVERVLAPFPAALAAYREARAGGRPAGNPARAQGTCVNL